MDNQNENSGKREREKKHVQNSPGILLNKSGMGFGAGTGCAGEPVEWGRNVDFVGTEIFKQSIDHRAVRNSRSRVTLFVYFSFVLVQANCLPKG